jgi:NAD(P) transhydrogenase subunit alpha
MSEAYQAKQKELIAGHIKMQDIVITTALIPGRPAPRLITAEMVASMKPGAVIVDLAAERGGNCELTKPGELIQAHGIQIFGPVNLAGTLPVNATSLYAKNLLNFLETMFDRKTKAFAVNWEDEIVKGTLIAKDGKIVHPSLMPKEAA